MLSCLPFCSLLKSIFQRGHHENTAAHAAAPSETGTAALPSPERLSLRLLSDRYGGSRLGVLVLAYAPCRDELSAEAADSIAAAYCNRSVAALFAVSPADGADVGSAASSVLEVLQQTEPALLGDLRAHLLRFAASDPTGNLSLYLQARKYPEDRKNILNTSSTTSRRWVHALVEPVLLEARFSACGSYGVVPRQKPSRNKLWQTRSVRPAAGAEASTSGSRFGTVLASARGVVPGIMVMFQPISSEHPFGESHMSITTSAAYKVGPLASSGASFGMPGPTRPPAACRSIEAGAVTVTVVNGSGGRQPQPGRPGLISSAPSSRTFAPGTQEVSPTRGLMSSEVTAADCVRIREGAVLAGLTPLVTAFTADGKAVLYQNPVSVAYYGVRAHSPLQTAVGGGRSDVFPNRAPEDITDSILGELFALEPGKLARMVADVCMEGRVWKGIVQVPIACTTAASLAMPTPSGESRCRPLAEHGSGGSIPAPSSTGILASASSSLAAAVHRLQGVRPSPFVGPDTGAGALRQSLGRVLEVASGIDPDGTAAVAVTDDAVSGGGGDGTALEPAASLPACSSMLNTAMSMTDDAPTMDVGGLQKLSSMLDVDPLATSTWGLLMDINDQMSTQGTAPARAQTGERTSVLLSGASGLAAPVTKHHTTKRILMASSTSVVRTMEVEPIPRAGGMRATTVGVSAAVPWVLSGASIHGAGSDAAGGAGGLSAMCRARFRHSSDFLVGGGAEVASTQGGQGCCTGAEGLGAGVHAVRRTALMVVAPQQQQGGGARALLRRCTSRGDVNAAPPPAFSRMITFASNLKTTPSVVQLTLQQAVSGSIGCAGVGVAAACDRTPLECVDSGRTSAANSCLYATAPASPLLPPDGSIGAQPSDRDVGASPKPCEEEEFVVMCSEEGGAPTLRLSSAGPSLRTAFTAAVQLPPSAQTIQADRPSGKDLSLPQPAQKGRPVTASSLPAIGGRDSSNPSNTFDVSSRAIFRTMPHRREGGRNVAISKLFVSASMRATGMEPLRADTTATDSIFRGMKPNPSVAPVDLGATSSTGRMDAMNGGGTGGAGARRVLSVGYCWHEITATRIVDPISGQYAILLTQVDVTAKVEAERHLAFVTEAEHRLLEQIFPRHVLAYMTEQGGPVAAQTRGDAQGEKAIVRDINKLATSHAEVTLLFADIQGFTPMCKLLEARVVMAFLNDLFTRFDQRLEDFGVYKVETIGDCYFVAGGLIHEDEHGMPAVRAQESHADPLHAEKVLMFAKAMLEDASQVTLPTGGPVRMRIGIHSGPVVSGVVGQRMPRFCLFGDTVNTASRMESTGMPGCIHASEAARRLLPNESWIPTGGTEVKGKGLMNTYLWAPPGQEFLASLSHNLVMTARKTCFSPNGASVASPGTGASCGSGGDGGGRGGATNNAAAILHFNSGGGFAQVWPSVERCSNGGAAEDSVSGLAQLLLPEGMR